jgi:hypothetical protein
MDMAPMPELCVVRLQASSSKYRNILHRVTDQRARIRFFVEKDIRHRLETKTELSNQKKLAAMP